MKLTRAFDHHFRVDIEPFVQRKQLEQGEGGEPDRPEPLRILGGVQTPTDHGEHIFDTVNESTKRIWAEKRRLGIKYRDKMK